MFHIQQLLERFKNLTNTEKGKKEYLIKIFVKNKILVTPNQISFSRNIVFIKVPPIIKTEILLNKEEFLSKIQKIPGLMNIKDIH